MSKKKFLSACIIARDSEEDIAWCLEGLEGEVDEIIVVDTGSEDRTKEIARRYTKQVYDFKWCDDFAAAKNFALSKARGAWVFFPDSDERLTDDSGGGKLRKVIEDVAAKGADTISIVRREVDMSGIHIHGLPDNLAERAIRRTRGLHYFDPIHEYLAYENGRKVSSVDVPGSILMMWHRGYAPERMQGKNDRNLKILERVEREGKKKLYLHYYLAGLYYFSKRWKDVCRE